MRFFKRRLRYGNTKVKVGDEVFDSRKEYNRWCELEMLQNCGEITGLTRDRKECTFTFVKNGVKICSYIADAIYYENGVAAVEDTKSEITRKNNEYRIKKKLMLAFFGITVKEV